MQRKTPVGFLLEVYSNKKNCVTFPIIKNNEISFHVLSIFLDQIFSLDLYTL